MNIFLSSLFQNYPAGLSNDSEAATKAMLSTPADYTHKRPLILIRVCLMTTYNSMGIYYQSLNTRSCAWLIGLISMINRKTKFVTQYLWCVSVNNRKSHDCRFHGRIYSTIKLKKCSDSRTAENRIMYSAMNLKYLFTVRNWMLIPRNAKHRKQTDLTPKSYWPY